MTVQCQNCGRKSGDMTTRCYWCGRIGTLVEIAGKRPRLGARYAEDDAFFDDDEGEDEDEEMFESPVALSEIEATDVQRLKTRDPQLDEFLGGGWVRGCAYVLVGGPGTGKSTFVLQMGKAARVERLFYLNAEETGDKIKSRARRVKMPSKRIVCWPKKVGRLDKALDAIDDAPDMTVIDSLQAMQIAGVRDRNERLVKVMEAAIDFAQDTNSVVFVISRVNKEGSLSGTNDVEHEGDGTLHLRLAGSEADPKRTLKITKHRHGPAPRSIVGVLGYDGFDFSKEPDKAPEKSTLRAVE